MIYPLIFRTFKLIQLQIAFLICLVQFLGAFARIPLGLEFGEHLRDLAKIDAVGAFIGTGILRILDLTARHGFFNDVSQFANAVVLVIAPNVERLVVDYRTRGIEYRNKRA